MSANRSKAASAEHQLRAFSAKYTTDVAKLTNAVLLRMRARLPGALMLVYDNHNACARTHRRGSGARR